MIQTVKENTKFIKDYEVGFYELNRNGCIKEAALIRFLQEIAAAHAEEFGFGYSFVTENNCAWYLLKYHIKIHKWPANNFKLHIETWPRGMYKLTCRRDFEVFSADNELLASASSAWAIVDLGTKRILHPMKTLLHYPALPEFSALDTDFPKINGIERTDAQKVFEVLYDDIDVNQHVNNSNYLTWALETLNHDFRLNHAPKEIEINYKKELKLGDRVLSLVEFDESNLSTLHILKNPDSGEEICALKVSWRSA